jgi:hypothetical protein
LLTAGRKYAATKARPTVPFSIRKEVLNAPPKISADFAEYGPTVAQAVKQMNFPP